MPDSLYDTDILIWSERQADLLRRLARGERLNETIDWENVIEEVESVGRSEFHACESLLRQALIHLLKLYLEPDSNNATAHWQGEVIGFLIDATARFSPSMRQKIDLPDLFEGVVFRLHAGGRGQSGALLPETCPFLLDDLLNERPDVMALVGKLGRPKEAGDAG
jgi:hypothetical protein